jgi:hypothetical protein
MQYPLTPEHQLASKAEKTELLSKIDHDSQKYADKDAEQYAEQYAEWTDLQDSTFEVRINSWRWSPGVRIEL